MQLQLRGRKTTYHAGYRANASGDNIGIGLWTNNHTLDNLKDLVYLCPDDDGDKLVINVREAERQGIRIAMETQDGSILNLD